MKKITLILITIFLSLLFSTASRADAEWSYTVRPGDNLWNFSQKYLHSIDYWSKLAKYNKIKKPKALPPGTILHVPVAWLRQPPQAVNVVLVFGLVELRRASQPGRVALEAGMRIKVNDRVISKQGSALFELANGSQLRILPNSELVFDALTVFEDSGMVDTRIRLERGRINSKVPKLKHKKSRYEIITPAAVTSVRGTEFWVAMDAETRQMFTEVPEGRVSVANDEGQQEVASGYGINLKQGEVPPPPVKLLPATKIEPINTPIVSSSQLFRWAALPGAEKYRVSFFKRVATSASASSVPYVQIIESVTQKTEYRFTGFDKGVYRLVVNGISQEGMRGLSAGLDISSQPLEAPELEVEQDKKSVQLSWPMQENADGYRIKISRQTLLGAKEEVITQSATEYAFTLSGAKQHSVTVEAVVDNMPGQASETVELVYRSRFYDALKRLGPFIILAPLL